MNRVKRPYIKKGRLVLGEKKTPKRWNFFTKRI